MNLKKLNILFNKIMLCVKNKELKVSKARRFTFNSGDIYLRGKGGKV